ncbi:MAG: FAD-binding oxidoreductase [Pirellulales bacterium]
MATTLDSTLPLDTQLAPASQDEFVAAVREAVASRTPIYTIGGGTSLDYGLPAKTPGLGIATTGTGRVVDYPARDMTITVESGITIDTLAATLAAERQWLPIDVPESDLATLGGVVATAWSGPRRYAQGTIRDYVIGIRAIDGHGTVFNGGGRVVKNVAGYDFCKLLTGSLGTLGVITQLTLKVKPLPEASALWMCDLPDAETAERLLAALVDSRTTPTAIELLAGPAWQQHEVLTPGGAAWARLVVGLEGTAAEVEWMGEQLAAEWRALSIEPAASLIGDATRPAWQALTDFPTDRTAPLVLKVALPPSRVTQYFDLVRGIDAECSLQAHAGDGVLVVRFARFDLADASRVLVGKLQATASAWGGSATVLSCAAGELTRQAVWGGRTGAVDLMEAIKRRFDPHHLLNPGRFLYELS